MIKRYRPANHAFGGTIEDPKGEYVKLEDLKVGYTRTMAHRDKTLPFMAISTLRTGIDTHILHYIAEPLEEEKVECDHVLNVPINLAQPEAYMEYRKQFDFCPKCGEKLKGEN